MTRYDGMIFIVFTLRKNTDLNMTEFVCENSHVHAMKVTLQVVGKFRWELVLSCNVIPFHQKVEPEASVKKGQTAEGETLKTGEDMVVRNEFLMETAPGDGGHVEYTELALECLDLKAQQELLSPPVSGEYNISCLLWFCRIYLNL